MTWSSIQIALPPEGFLVRDFAITALAELISGAGSLKVTNGNAIIEGISINSILAKYGEALQDPKLVKLFQPDFKSRDKIIECVGSLTKTKPTDLATAVREYGEWVATQGQNVLDSLSKLEFRPEKGTILKWGVKPDIEAIQYFKLNLYAGRRSFLPSKYMNAGMKLDIHAIMLLLLGAGLSLVGTRRRGKSRIAVHLSYRDLGVKTLWQSLQGLIEDVDYQTEPLIMFRLATAFRLRIPAFQPIAFFEISIVGNKPALLSYHSVELDYYLSRFVEKLGKDRYLVNLMTFSLRNWNETRREFRLIAQAAYNISMAIYLTLTSSLVDAVGEFYRIARYTYETSSDEFARALIFCRRQLNWWHLGQEVSIEDAKDEFKRLLARVVRAVEATKRSI
jgi:hypothetical protein